MHLKFHILHNKTTMLNSVSSKGYIPHRFLVIMVWEHKLAVLLHRCIWTHGVLHSYQSYLATRRKVIQRIFDNTYLPEISK
jgi:hypothetical protein